MRERPFTTYDFIMQLDSADMGIFIEEPRRGASCATLLLKTLKTRYDFLLRGLGNIHVECVEYRKSNSLFEDSEHEYLVVTVKESSRFMRTGFLLVDRLDDDPPFSDTSAPSYFGSILSSITQWVWSLLLTVLYFFIGPVPWLFAPSSTTSPPPTATSSRPHRRRKKWDPIDTRERLVVLRNIEDALDVQGQCAYDVLMTMDLRQAPRQVTFEDFLLLVRTTSRNAPLHNQCFWLAYTIWKVLALETGAPVERTRRAVRQGKHSSWLWLSGKHSFDGDNEVNGVSTPETIKLQWEVAKVFANQEWAASLQALRALQRSPSTGTSSPSTDRGRNQ
ncbi:uncharacterized protein EV420DRAFT_1756845 [Desarmillaria tabescens]|uniref:Uncharacterized protein n=1 Tax=Armillaria tabescens TaxID=1929756 RepID=A0AA39T725_ARMTA|nr:uncharacterized protein EV420DRAFT_1756845 [Desarmillaria tabescens]KAK0469001.1 hypothetical protein EV420DRAFT_1756845 [Desarmillaria tabescens]